MESITSFAYVLALVVSSVMAQPHLPSSVGDTVIVGPGAMSGADRGVLEYVADNRMAGYAEPTIPTIVKSQYVLVATESCALVGLRGFVVVRAGSEVVVRRAVVVDCQDARHRLNGGSLTDLGLVADVNYANKDLWHRRGYLVLKKETSDGTYGQYPNHGND